MLFTDCLLHALEDTARLLPFLFLTYLVMEYLEQRAGERSARAVRRTGRLGPPGRSRPGGGAPVRIFRRGLQPVLRRSDHRRHPDGSLSVHFGRNAAHFLSPRQ